MDYQTFLNDKLDYGANSGFEPLYLPNFLFDFQVALTEWAIRKGRAAIFADCGLGKTPMQLVWSQNIVLKTNKPVLILTPLAVSGQTLREADKFQIEAQRAKDHPKKASIYVTNYEQLHKLSALDYAGVVCDESSILKNFDGVYKAQITEFMRQVPYRLLTTATAAPNDWDELGTSSEALGYFGYMDMIKMFFENDEKSNNNRRLNRWELFNNTSNNTYHLRGHAVEHFWRWVASWSRAMRKPSDFEFNDDEFVLPELIENHIMVSPRTIKTGQLFETVAINFQEQREVTRRTISERCEIAAEKVVAHKIATLWCNLNDEGTTLAKLIPDAWEVSGRTSDEEKEEAVDWFVNGTDTQRRLISKPKIMGFGMNFQHCNYMTWFPTFSYEQYYQGVRRLWRFGQNRSVTVDNIYPEGGERMLEAIIRKSKAADEMFAQLISHMQQALSMDKTKYIERTVPIPSWLSNGKK